ncbi:hydroxyethylthiazole kinase-like [Rutidosis leptorrhynchoides]|uniref:hydroxyethylthiazole kinase-like n=1 Tax=Rutidosis leptorrhynchoides TaxID=125765 RepID=UPI003A99026E
MEKFGSLQITLIEMMNYERAVMAKAGGDDSLHESSDALEAANSLAKSSVSIVVISGSVDYVTVGQQVIVTALIVAFIAIDPTNAFEAIVFAFGLAGEIGKDLAKGPASLCIHLIDSLNGLNEDTVLNFVNIKSFS